MLRYGLIPIFAFFFLILFPGLSPAVKPLPPLELTFSYHFLSETETRITLIAEANVEGDKVSISLERPLGLRLIEGEEHWEGAMKKGEQRQLELVVEQGASDSYQILGRMSIHYDEGLIFRQERQLTLKKSSEKSLRKQASKPQTPIRHNQPQGNILEFRE